MRPIHHLPNIEEAAARISDLARNHDLGTPVPGLGRWKIRDVVAHLGGVHRWATRIVENRSMDGPGFKKAKLDGVELCDWFDDGVTRLVDVLASTPFTNECPNFNPGSANTVQFWARRQLHETTVHRWDVERAAETVTPIPAPIAADGIDEYLDVFVRTRGKQTLVGPLTLTSSDPARSWALTPAAKPGRVDIADGRSLDSEAEITGPAEGLLLHLWGRVALEDSGLTTHGSPEVATSLRPPAG